MDKIYGKNRQKPIKSDDKGLLNRLISRQIKLKNKLKQTTSADLLLLNNLIGRHKESENK